MGVTGADRRREDGGVAVCGVSCAARWEVLTDSGVWWTRLALEFPETEFGASF